VLGPGDPLADGHQLREQVTCPGRVACLPDEAGEVYVDGQGFRVLGPAGVLNVG
jgi:hypothetical protein